MVTHSVGFVNMSSATPGSDWDLCHQAITIQAKETTIFMLNKHRSDSLPFSRRAVRGKVPLAMEFKLSFCWEALESMALHTSLGCMP